MTLELHKHSGVAVIECKEKCASMGNTQEVH